MASHKHTLKDHQVEELKKRFDSFDKNKDGKISKAELAEVLNVPADNQVLSEIFSKIDKNNNGFVEFNEFKDHMTGVFTRVFTAWDANGDGQITKAEFAAVVKKRRPNASDEQIDAVFQLVDENKDGSIDFNELVDIIQLQTGQKQGTFNFEDFSNFYQSIQSHK